MTNPMAKPDKILLFGTQGSSKAYTIRDFLHRSLLPFEWIEVRAAAAEIFSVHHLDCPRTFDLPVCIFSDGTCLQNPTMEQVLDKIGWLHMPSQAEYDLAIYGGGPAGLSAAVYGASEGLKTVLVECYAVGGQAGSSSRIENYLGSPKGISGADLAERARKQAYRFGAEILMTREGVGADFADGKGIGILADGSRIISRGNLRNRSSLSKTRRSTRRGICGIRTLLRSGIKRGAALRGGTRNRRWRWKLRRAGGYSLLALR
jgi:thioredoxin reductase (NADPH)